MIVMETSFFIHYKINETWLNTYMRQILNSDLIWTHDTKDEFHRWFTYTFLHVDTSHVTMNVLLQVSARTFILGGQKSNIIEIGSLSYGSVIELIFRYRSVLSEINIHFRSYFVFCLKWNINHFELF